MATLRRYDHDTDREAVQRIWREVGWLKEGQEKAMDTFVQANRGYVAELNGEAETLVLTAPGTLRYVNRDLSMCAVTAVTTSRVARKQGLAGRLTAKAIAESVAEGALVAGLGMFEQGFYNRLGFGTGGYEHWVAFDPANLRITKRPRPPQRITEQDWQEAHAASLNRMRGHGACNLLPPGLTQAELMWSKKSFGLGYRNGPDGAISHYLWCWVDEAEFGPYRISWMNYQTYDQLLELLGVVKGLGDQVRLFKMREPPGIQLQDLIKHPFRQRIVTEKSKYESSMRARAYWQMRICDLAGCLAQTHLPGGEAIRFGLHLKDPIAALLDDDAPWRGVAGDYVVTLGPESSATPGQDDSLPTLTSSVGAFTRLWLGVRPATGLAVTDELAGPADLLSALDWAIRLPNPKPDWDF